MRKILAASLVAVLAACGGQSFKDQARDAMPAKDTTAMGSPQSSSTPVASGGPSSALTQDSTAGQHSPFFDLTVGVSAAFNVPTALFLGLLQHVSEDFEPTSCDATSCTWGPGSGALDYNDFKLVVSKSGDSFAWELSGRPKSQPTAAFVVVASGLATPGPQRHHGSGNLTIDFDKMATLDGAPAGNATGQMNVTSYSNVGPAQLAVTFMGARDGQVSTQRENILYSYANDTSGGGDLDFAVHNTTTGDRFASHSRWKNDGQGRADVGGMGSGYNVALSECWGTAPFNVVYFNSNVTAVIPPWGGPVQGSESSCAYTSAAPSTKSAP